MADELRKNGVGAILALDPGMALGWALRTPDGLVTSGTLDLRSRRFEGGGMRYLRLRRWLTEMKTCAGVPVGTWKRDLTGKGNSERFAGELVHERGAPPSVRDSHAIRILRSVSCRRSNVESGPRHVVVVFARRAPRP